MTASESVDGATARESLLFAEDGSSAAVPRINGELTFAAPWESQAFALCLSLVERGLLGFEVFRRSLIRAIGEWEAEEGADRGAWSYYERWLTALERVLVSQGVVSEQELLGHRLRLASIDHHHH